MGHPTVRAERPGAMNTAAARAFRDMADRIEALKEGEFGGAILVVPPADQTGNLNVNEISLLLSGPQADLAFFWSSAKTKIEIAQVEFDRRYRERDVPFGMR